MKALLIKPVEQSIETIDISNQNDIIQLIGYETIISDDLGEQGDKLYFDEECFLRGTDGRFQIDKLIPVSGIGVIVGSTEDGELADIRSNLNDLMSRIKFL